MDAPGGPEHGEKVQGIDPFPVAVVADPEDGADIGGEDGIVLDGPGQHSFQRVEDDDLSERQAAELEGAHHLHPLQRRTFKADRAAAKMGAHHGDHGGGVGGLEDTVVRRGEIFQLLQGVQRGGGIFVEEQVGAAVVLAAHALQCLLQEGKERMHSREAPGNEAPVQTADLGRDLGGESRSDAMHRSFHLGAELRFQSGN